MSDDNVAKMAKAATSVMNALQPLSPDERSRVIQSAAALFNVSVAQAQTPQQSRSQPDVAKGGGGSGKPMSLVELLKEKHPASNSQRIACFAYYREKFEGIENFASGDLSAYFAKAKLPAPGSNYARDYNNAVKSAWIHDDGAQSYLTQDGENAVEAGFDGKAKPRGATAGKKKRKAGKSK